MGRLVGVDVGGTFTDVVVFDGGVLSGFKVATTADQSEGVSAALDWDRSDLLLHGTTAATNALLEERGAKVALVTTPGFEDAIEIARQDRPSLYDSGVDRPAPLVAREFRLSNPDDLDNLDPDVVVVGLLESYRDSSEEEAMVATVRSSTSAPVIAAAEVSPEFREYERIATAALAAYLTPSVGNYLTRLDQSVGAGRKLVMTSSGGLLPVDRASESAARLVLSGPAGGIVAASALARFHGYSSVFAFDMGGTSTDVCRITNGEAVVDTKISVAGRVNRVPSLPVRTIGAGGGSVAWVDAGGALRVGPRSAGSEPGPASYGKGGSEATVTDANLVAGTLPHDLRLAGRMALDVEAAHLALARLAATLGMTVEAVAAGVLEIVDSHMEHALRSVSIEEGTDPRSSVLVAYGGAGALHATRLARRLGIPKVIIPPFAGVFSALGLLLATPEADAGQTVLLEEHDTSLPGRLTEVQAASEKLFQDRFGVAANTSLVGFQCRYRGQSHELDVSSAPEWSALRAGFEAAHQRQFGFVRSGEPIELVNLRARSLGIPPLDWSQVRQERVGLEVGEERLGPMVLPEETTAVLLGPRDRLKVLRDGSLEISCD